MQIITTHFNADFDCLGSLIAARKLYPDAWLVFPGAQEKNVRDFLAASDHSFQFEKIKNIKLQDITDLILVDTKHTSRIGVFGEIALKESVQVHIYDHHPSANGDIKGDVEVLRDRGAASTIMVEVIRERNLQFTPEEATIVLLGIFEDTGRFTFTSTQPEDFQAAAFLLSQGANLNTVSDFMTSELNADQVSLLNDMICNVESYTINGVSLAVTTAALESYIGDLALLTHKMKDIQGLNVLFALVRMEQRIHLVGRSRIDAVDVSEIAAEFGGGGHPNAASANIRDITLPQAKEQLIALLNEKVHPFKLAGDIMVSHVKAVPYTATIRYAENALTRYNINSMPVLDDASVPVGLITRQIVERVEFHKLDLSLVTEFMLQEFVTVTEDAPYSDVDEAIILGHQRLVPVVSSNKSIVGIISRGDLLHGLYNDILKKPNPVRGQSNRVRFPYAKGMKKSIQDRQDKTVFQLLEQVAEVGDELSVTANLVGGFVRDLLLNIKNLDLDIVVEGDGIAFANALVRKIPGKVRSHEKFGTAVVVLDDGRKLDIASARTEYYERPAALPSVEMSSLKHDLFRRDFTINSLCIRLNGGDSYRLIDFFGGQRDLKERVINVMHNLSFVEDPTRVFRAIRFEQRFNFTIGKQTMSLLAAAVKRDLFNHLSGARLFVELKLMLKEKNPIKLMKRMRDLDLLQFIHPNLSLLAIGEELFENIGEALSLHHLLYTGISPDICFIYFMGLLEPLSDREVDEVCTRLNVSEKYRNRVLAARKNSAISLSMLSRQKNMRPSQIYEIMHDASLDVMLFMTALTRSERIKKEISFYLTKLDDINTELKGTDLMRLGIEEGPNVGLALKALKDSKLNGIVSNRKQEEAFIRKRYGLSIKNNI